MASIKLKKFHCQGGSVYSLYPGSNTERMLELVVALQTISDYLDNLCDRTEVKEERAFRQLHLAFTEALEPGNYMSDYYLYYPLKKDGGYLYKLVERCRACIKGLPTYNLVKEHTVRLGRLYSDLQVYKHLPLDIREKKVMEWSMPYLKDYNGISNWEFAAAAGSTLAIFMLFAIASDDKCSGQDIAKILEVYFPWVCGLHILLDYYIDLKEDKEWGDLNFVSYYSNMEECESRLKLFIRNATEGIIKLDNSIFHVTVIQGLLALYLSDPKAEYGEQAAISRRLVRSGGKMAHLLWRMCKYLRKKRVV